MQIVQQHHQRRVGADLLHPPGPPGSLRSASPAKVRQEAAPACNSGSHSGWARGVYVATCSSSSKSSASSIAPSGIERDDQCGGGDRDDDGPHRGAASAPPAGTPTRLSGQRTPSGAVHRSWGTPRWPPSSAARRRRPRRRGSRAGGGPVPRASVQRRRPQGLQVSIETLNAYASNPAYIFPAPSSTTIPGLGDLAVIETSNTNERRITVKLGTNAIQVTVDFYTKPVDDAFVTQLAKDAVGSGDLRRRPVGRRKERSPRTDQVIFVDEAAEQITAAYARPGMMKISPRRTVTSFGSEAEDRCGRWAL